MCNDADVIIAVSNEHARACGEGALSFEEITGKPVPDPYGGNMSMYFACVAQICDAFDKIYDICERELAKKRGN